MEAQRRRRHFLLQASARVSNGLLIQRNKDIIRVHISRSSQDGLSSGVVAKVFYAAVFSTDEEFDSKINDEQHHLTIGHEQKSYE